MSKGEDREAADELGLLIRDIYREHGIYTPDQTVADLIIAAGYRKVTEPAKACGYCGKDDPHNWCPERERELEWPQPTVQDHADGSQHG